MEISSPSPARFLAEHSDPSTWSSVDFEVYEHLVQTQDVELDQVLAEHHVVDGPLAAV